jgi:drug/metabolite transporter (DMT)-like permease
MSCNINRSINVGFLSSIFISLLSYFFLKDIKQLDSTKLLFLFVVFFVIATSMDYFNYCYTKCNSVKSSVTYGVFTVALIYLFFGLFVEKLQMTGSFLFVAGGNVLLLAILHYYLCNSRYLEKQ